MKKSKKLTITEDKALNSFHRQFKLITKLRNSEEKKVIITFEKMELSIMEGTKTIERHKYMLGDIGIWKYTSAIKRYVRKGYKIEATISNREEIFKKARKDKNEN